MYGVCFCGGAPGLFTQVQARFDAETSIPHMRGGMLNATTPLSVVQQLQAMGVPAEFANAAAARHPDCINSALDWACDSERRHCSARVDSTALPHVPTPPRSWGQLLAPVRDVEVVDLDTVKFACGFCRLDVAWASVFEDMTQRQFFKTSNDLVSKLACS